MNKLKSSLGRQQTIPPCRRRFSEDFKRDTVRLVVEEKYTFAAAAKAVGVSVKSLRNWHQKFAPEPTPCGDNATFDELREEVKRLRRQLKRAEPEKPRLQAFHADHYTVRSDKAAG